MTYREASWRLGFGTDLCLGGCGITARSHKTGFIDPFGVAHWEDRRFTKRGLRKLLLLMAKRDRLASPDFLNAAGLTPIHWYMDEQRANAWAAELGVRFPVAYSAPERRVVALVPGLSKAHPSVYTWARRGETI